MRFVETPAFTEQIVDALDDDSYNRLQLALVMRPERGALIRGTGGLRKLRWPGSGHGKSGGVRVIYFWRPRDETFCMRYAYSKTEVRDITPLQARVLRRGLAEEYAEETHTRRVRNQWLRGSKGLLGAPVP